MTLAALTPIDDADLEAMLLIRRFESALLELFSQGKLHGTTHTCIGQEYVPVALRPLLGPRDFVFSNHRGHGHYIARYDDPAGLLAEIMGKAGAVCGGVGGSQHVYREDGYLSTGVQGESLPVATGVALHFKRSKWDAIALAYIGDGTWGEGAVYESLNIAKLWSLPLVVVVENNGIAQTTPTAMQMAGTIEGRVAAFGIRYLHVDTCDVARVRDALRAPIAEARAACSPLVVELATLRVAPHSKSDDTRPKSEIDDIAAREWHARYRAAFPAQFAATDARAKARMDGVVADVEGRAPAKGSTE